MYSTFSRLGWRLWEGGIKRAKKCRGMGEPEQFYAVVFPPRQDYYTRNAREM